ncbi:hypothetical protein PInf_014611 [Phytophthora infestans]|nr:hypothetical protein PInf_014611 [Phytophthora infestans]
MRNALAELAMRLVDADDREDFRKADGVTAIACILEEQATLSYAWSTSEAFGTAWEEYEVHDSLQFTLVAICHASIDSDISAEMHELGTLEILYRTLSVILEQLSDYVPFVLEGLRNLCASDCGYRDLPTELVQRMWQILLSENKFSLLWQELAAEVLTNIAAAESSRSAATPERLSATLSLFLRAACSLLLICELDTRRPRGHLRHSGVVYLAELTDKSQDGALKQSMEALVHNLSWSDPAAYKLACEMLTTAASFPVRNGKGYGAQREFYRNRIGSVHGIASPNIHASVRAAAIAARRVRQFRQKHAPTLHTVLDVDNETQIREASPVQEQTGNPVKRKMKLHLSLDKLEKPELPMMILHEEPITFDDPPLVVSNGSDFGQAQPSGRSRRASSITLSMNSPEAAEFNEVATTDLKN